MMTPVEDAMIRLHPAPGFPWPVGIVVLSVFAGSGAQDAGLFPEDEITRIYTGGRWTWVTDTKTVARAAESVPVGTPIPIELVRNGTVY